MSRSISVLFLTLDRLSSIKLCFNSLSYLLDMPFILEWLILDNHSDSVTTNWLKQEFIYNKKVKIMFEPINHGVAGGRSILLEKAQGNTFLILDSDVFDPKHTFLHTLISLLEQDDIGIAGLHGANYLALPKGKLKAVWPVYGYVDAISGYCQMFDRRVYDAGCRLDMVFNPYSWEDADFCLQVRHKTGLRSYAANIAEDALVHSPGNTNAGTEEDRSRRWSYFSNKWWRQLDYWQSPRFAVNTPFVSQT